MALRASFTLVTALYIGSADALLPGDLALGEGCAAIEAIAQNEDLALPFVEVGEEVLIKAPAAVAGLHRLEAGILAADGVHEGEGGAVAVTVDGVGQRDLALVLADRAEIHEDLVCYPPPNAFLKH